jgi:hypothetical protein
MVESVVFDGTLDSLNRLFREHPQGTVFLCPTCGAKLTVALSWEKAGKERVHPGIYCPTDLGHVLRIFYFPPPPPESTPTV